MSVPTPGFSPPRRMESHAAAERTLADAPYLAYCLVQACKLFVKLVSRRWPELE